MLFAILLVAFATERQAAAYTDPGSGALLWQFLAASFVGMMFYFRKITTWVRGKTSKKGPQD